MDHTLLIDLAQSVGIARSMLGLAIGECNSLAADAASESETQRINLVQARVQAAWAVLEDALAPLQPDIDEACRSNPDLAHEAEIPY